MKAKPHTFIVRIWLEPNKEPGLWRASVLDAATRERWLFTDPQALCHFLKETEGVWLLEEAQLPV